MSVVPFQPKATPDPAAPVDPVDVPLERPADSDVPLAESDAGRGGGGGGSPPDRIKAAGPCPVRALGCAGGIYRFVDFRGELHELSESKLFGRGGLARLFGGDMSWLRKAFPRTEQVKDAEGNVTERVNGINERQACLWLVRACADEPMWDEGVPVRGIGVWPQTRGSAPGCLVHLGDKVGFLACERPARAEPTEPADDAGAPVGLDVPWARPGFRIGRAWYLAKPPMAVLPSRTPAAVDLGRTLVEFFAHWNWDEPTAPAVLAGLVAQGTLGAASPWRGHSILVGIEGCGKSSLIGFLAELLFMSKVFDEFSEAGIRNAFENEARQVILDEAEGENDGGRGFGAVERTIRFIRRLSGEEGARGVRGKNEGGVRSSNASGAAILGAIRPPPLDAQDITRFTILNLRPLGQVQPARVESLNALRAELVAAGPALLSRMLLGRERYLASFRAAKTALVGTHGLGTRQADQVACAIAGYWTLISNRPLEPGLQIDSLIQQTFGFVVAQVRENAATESTPMQCWRDLLSLQPDVWGGGSRHSIAWLISEALLPGQQDKRDRLLQIGIRVVTEGSSRGRRTGIYIANQSEPLARLFASGVRARRWASGWGDALKDLAGAEPARMNMGRGGSDRVTYLPLGADYMPQTVLDGADEEVEFRVRPPAPPEGDG